MTVMEKGAVLSGVGKSKIGRGVGQTALRLTAVSCLAAIEDAGLTRDDIDGVSTWPGAAEHSPGYSGRIGVYEVQDALRLKLNWYSGGQETPGQLGALINAIMAVSSGLAENVLCFRTLWESSAQGEGTRATALSVYYGGEERRARPGLFEWGLPYGQLSGSTWFAMYAQRYFSLYGCTREQLAGVALNARRNAAGNPDAVFRKPMTLDDYMQARIISSPLCLFDCDMPIDGSTAVIVSRAGSPSRFRQAPVQVEAVGSAFHGRSPYGHLEDITRTASHDAADMLWSRTDLKPSDVDFAEVYDGYSISTLHWLEALRFCANGEAGAFVEGGVRIGRDGDMPIATDGGQLSGGRLHGYGYLFEAVRQLRGEAGGTQLARRPEVGVVGVGGGPHAGAVLLSRAA